MLELERAILDMGEAGATRQEIADRFGLNKVQIKSWINRYNRRQAKLATGIPPRLKGGPQKGRQIVSKEAEQAYEIQRLQMGNKLLRNFRNS